MAVTLRSPRCSAKEKCWEWPLTSEVPASLCTRPSALGMLNSPPEVAVGGDRLGNQGTGRSHHGSLVLLKEWLYLLLKFMSFRFSCFRQSKEKKWMKNTTNTHQIPWISFCLFQMRGFSFIWRREWLLWRIRWASFTAPLQEAHVAWPGSALSVWGEKSLGQEFENSHRQPQSECLYWLE